MWQRLFSGSAWLPEGTLRGQEKGASLLGRPLEALRMLVFSLDPQNPFRATPLLMGLWKVLPRHREVSGSGGWVLCTSGRSWGGAGVTCSFLVVQFTPHSFRVLGRPLPHAWQPAI